MGGAPLRPASPLLEGSPVTIFLGVGVPMAELQGREAQVQGAGPAQWVPLCLFPTASLSAGCAADGLSAAALAAIWWQDRTEAAEQEAEGPGGGQLRETPERLGRSL